MNTLHYDVVVVGGGPAGLQATLTLGRMHRAVLMLDSGTYRNETATHMHNFVTHDGTPPQEFRASARAQLQVYDSVEVREARATAISPVGEGWEVALEDSSAVDARKVLLATGLRDELPRTPGLADLWGDVVAHCPYCHGHELSGRPVAILGSAAHVTKLAALMSRIASQVTVLTDGTELDEPSAKTLSDIGAVVRGEPVSGVRRSAAGAAVTFDPGSTEEFAGLFVSTGLVQAAPFAHQLGLDMLPSGCVRIDERGHTSRPGVYAAGDMAHLESLPMPMASVLTAAAAGLVAAAAADQDLLVEDPRLTAAT